MARRQERAWRIAAGAEHERAPRGEEAIHPEWMMRGKGWRSRLDPRHDGQQGRRPIHILVMASPPNAETSAEAVHYLEIWS
jgi:hypothetical protein